MRELREFMFERVYLGPAVRARARAASTGVVRIAVRSLRATIPTQLHASLPAATRTICARRVTDYLAGMTDRYCIRTYTELQVPRAFAR